MNQFLLQKRSFGILIILFAFLAYFFIPLNIPIAANRALLFFSCAALFWALEVIPLFATSITLVLFLTLFLTKQNTWTFFSQFSNPIIFLFFGGFVLAKALSKYHLDRYIARHFFRWTGTTSYSLICGHLFLAAFLSMWISNTAATVIVLSLISPTLQKIPKGDSLLKSLPLSVAFGASIGGISTPIGTPPNAVAIGILGEYGASISFINWMAMTLPLAMIILLFSSWILWLLFPSKTKVDKESSEQTSLSSDGKKVIFGSVAMITLWLTSPLHHIPEAIVAVLGVSYFTAMELIDAEDLKKIEWDVLFLMWGGLALGEAMKTSDLVPALFGEDPFSNYARIWIFVIFCILAIVLSSFMSSTAAANLLLPVIVSISPENKVVLCITVALCCSLAVTFPISTPPNTLAYSLHTVSTKEMFKAGALISLFSLLVILAGFDLVIPLFFGGNV
jgi:solute carrier family 13 (sodium-dependent dicarboxylate transporter), member 2/3/5